MGLLTPIRIDQIHNAQQLACERLQLYVSGAVYERTNAMADRASARLIAAGDEDGIIDVLLASQITSEIGEHWREFVGDYRRLLTAARAIAVELAFASWARQHEWYMSRAARLVEQGPMVAGGMEQVARRTVTDVLAAANQRTYSDGLQLSQRIWRMDNESQRGIANIVNAGVANGESATKIAKNLEQYLGANRDYPRWTSSRLRLTKAEIAAGDKRGLIRTALEDKTPASGVSYNALRLARNEIRTAHAMATERIMERQPWVQGARWTLSPAHPVIDICDEMAEGGEAGDGAYVLGNLPQMPAHVQCLCFWQSVSIPETVFADRMRDWMQTGSGWPEMSDYASELQIPMADIISGAAAAVPPSIEQRTATYLEGDAAALKRDMDSEIAQHTEG